MNEWLDSRDSFIHSLFILPGGGGELPYKSDGHARHLA